jgi:3-oxoacyl-[acyl-carrier protein] reductase
MTTGDYTGQVILVTGGASGIGQAQVAGYLAAGATQVIIVDVQPVAVTDARVRAFQLDLADEAAVSNWLVAEADLLTTVDVFLSTAGVLDGFTPALDTDFETMADVLRIDLLAPMQLTMALLPHMIARGHGEILYMASIAGQVAGGGGAAYTTAKHGLVGWMRQLALDYARTGVHINALAPGAIETPMNAADFAGDGAMAKQVAAETPLGRWASAAEVAAVSLFMTSPQAAYIQGQVFKVDGGWTIK